MENNKENKTPKRVKTMSAGRHYKYKEDGLPQLYYKISDEVNKAAQKKFYEKNKTIINARGILERLEHKGNIPQLKSFEKYPLYITEESVIRAYEKFIRQDDIEPQKIKETRDKIKILQNKLHPIILEN